MKKNSGFTMIELLVVISIIAILVTMIVSVVREVRHKQSGTYSTTAYDETKETYSGHDKKVTKYGTIIQDSFDLGAFTPRVNGYNYKLYNRSKTTDFLESISSRFNIGEIIEVDGLKWQRCMVGLWTPFPNPPMPVLEDGEDKSKHFKEYAKWINDHPHFGYPPLPMDFE